MLCAHRLEDIMSLKGKLLRTASAVLAALMLPTVMVTGAFAADLTLARNGGKSSSFADQAMGARVSDDKSVLEKTLDSEIAAGVELSREEAALRLYYLGMLNGTGVNENGGIDFALEKGLTRIEAAVLAVRMMGMEETAIRMKYAHPFYDVPEWASAYVGYLYSLGLLDDLLDGVFGPMFEPSFAETPERFTTYMLYSLGYRMKHGDYSYANAADHGRSIGICVTEEDAPLTRGDAVLSMYNTLRTTVKGSRRVMSDTMVEAGRLDYRDAVFMLWSDDKQETDTFLEAVGYSIDWILPDGFYSITSTDGSMALNVASTGANTDHEGVGVTVWEPTDDITQTFRIERTERGTYYLYSAASRSGFGRVIGTANGVEAGLYSSTSENAMEFYIEGSADGSWYIVSARNDGQCLSCSEPDKNGARVGFVNTLSAGAQTWSFERQGIMNSAGRELAVFVAESLVVTQGAFDDYSHMEQNALDIQPMERAVRAPFNGQIVRIDATEISCNAVWFQSNAPVLYADGTYDYMTVCFLHDNDISDLEVGQGYRQGDYFYDSGDFGVSSGKHVHVAVYRGRYSTSMRCGSGDVFAEDAFFLPDDTYVYDDYGLNWTKMSDAN